MDGNYVHQGGVQRLMEDSILNINFVFRITPLIGQPSTTTQLFFPFRGVDTSPQIMLVNGSWTARKDLLEICIILSPYTTDFVNFYILPLMSQDCPENGKSKTVFMVTYFQKGRRYVSQLFQVKNQRQICNHKNPGLTWKLKIIVEKISAHKNRFTVVILSG